MIPFCTFTRLQRWSRTIAAAARSRYNFTTLRLRKKRGEKYKQWRRQSFWHMVNSVKVWILTSCTEPIQSPHPGPYVAYCSFAATVLYQHFDDDDCRNITHDDIRSVCRHIAYKDMLPLRHFANLKVLVSNNIILFPFWSSGCTCTRMSVH